MVKWHTRQTQNLLLARACGFKSHCRQKNIDVRFSVAESRYLAVSSEREVMEMPDLPAFETMDSAFRNRDASYDGIFFAAVTTTGIFCRPSCPARKPLPGNVVYYSTPAEALFSGYRPCERCRPLAATADPEWLGNLVSKVERDPGTRIRDSELRADGLDPATVRRRFQSRFGLSFQAFQRARRLASAFEAIKDGGTIDDAVFDHGYESHSGFREAFSRLFGAAPAKAVSSNADFVRISWIDTSLGPMIAGSTNQGICLLEFSDRRMLEYQARTLTSRMRLVVAPGSSTHFEGLKKQLEEFFSGSRKYFDLPIVAPGTAFQERVWAALRRIPFGETRSYGQLAREIGMPSAVRAVARANGFNRVAILIPCHRVIGSDGGLGGYGGGLWRKQRLLELEGAPIPAKESHEIKQRAQIRKDKEQRELF
jgi:AraC family transcriptional regulator of adaptative response/methylated-DNA-[protein]-cysteine methyltransferase